MHTTDVIDPDSYSLDFIRDSFHAGIKLPMTDKYSPVMPEIATCS